MKLLMLWCIMSIVLICIIINYRLNTLKRSNNLETSKYTFISILASLFLVDTFLRFLLIGDYLIVSIILLLILICIFIKEGLVRILITTLYSFKFYMLSIILVCTLNKLFLGEAPFMDMLEVGKVNYIGIIINIILSIGIYLAFEYLNSKQISLESFEIKFGIFNNTKLNMIVKLSLYIFELICNIIIILLLYVTTIYKGDKYYNYFLIMVLIGTIFSLFIDTYLNNIILKISEYSMFKYKAKFLNKQLEDQLEHYQDVYKLQKRNSQILHDANKHNIVLHNLLERKKIDEAISYLEEIDKELMKIDRRKFTNNEVVDSILKNKAKIMSENNINYDFNIKIPNQINLSNFDVCIILSNLIDNSIEACKKVKDISNRHITIKFLIKGENLCIIIKNTYDGNINIKNNKIITSKSDKELHGYGIQNVTKIVLKNNGYIKSTYDNNVFNTNIYIPYITKDEETSNK